MKYLMIWLIKGYQFVSRKIHPPCCRFAPTCSCYAITAYKKHGFIKGSILASYRILRCNPYCRGGNDPVPDKFTLRRK